VWSVPIQDLFLDFHRAKNHKDDQESHADWATAEK
jgi:hypothetical protein